MNLSNDIKLMFGDFGEAATYVFQTITVIVDRSVEVVGDFGQVVDRRTVLSALKTDMPTPMRGQSITVGGTAYTLDGVISDDGHIVKVWLK